MLDSERLKQRALYQELRREDIAAQALAAAVAGRFGKPDLDHLPGVVPLVDGGRDVQSLVALKPDQPPPERVAQDLGDLGLADPGLALQEKRPVQLERQEESGRQRPFGDVVAAGEQVQCLIDGGGQGLCHGLGRQ